MGGLGGLGEPVGASLRHALSLTGLIHRGEFFQCKEPSFFKFKRDFYLKAVLLSLSCAAWMCGSHGTVALADYQMW